MSTFHIKKGDYHRQLALDLSDITTTGATAVRFRMRPQAGGALVVDADGTIVSATRVSYQFVSTQLNTAGIYNLEVALTYNDGVETVPTNGYVTVIIGEILS